MAINKAMRLALKALSYPDPDIKKTYKLERSVKNFAGPHLLKPIYKTWDHKVYCDGREILIRIYPIKNKISNNNPILLFFHGGGWVTESINTYNKVCINLSKHTGCKVISVEYRLAPEHPFPCGLNDCYSAAKEIMLNPKLPELDSKEIIVIGDSAGGNLAAAVSLMARDKGEFNINKQILIYPSTYNNHTPSSPFPSVTENGTDYLLTSKRICDYMELYMNNKDDLNNPYFAPLIAEDLTCQPNTLIITAEYDPLRDEGEKYGERLKFAGNKVTMFRMHDALHGFFALDPHYAHVKKTYQLINDFIFGVNKNV